MNRMPLTATVMERLPPLMLRTSFCTRWERGIAWNGCAASPERKIDLSQSDIQEHHDSETDPTKIMAPASICRRWRCHAW